MTCWPMESEKGIMKKITAFLLVLGTLVFVSPSIGHAVDKVCKPTQAIEEGPYYLATTPIRSDITDGQPGKRITIKFIVVDTKCKPIKGARVDIWFANAEGVYSGVTNKGDDLGAGKNSGMFLRGTQYSDVKGIVTFKGIYPGWYPARTIHIHEKIWIKGKEVLTTQTYFSDSQNSEVMATAPYNVRGTQKVTNKNDMILNRGGIDLEAALMKVSGSQATAQIVIR